MPVSRPAVLAALLLVLTPVQAAQPGLVVGDIDHSVAACGDFYRHATGKWLDANPIPADHARWGAFDQINRRNRAVLKEILEAAAKPDSASAGSNRRKVGDFYASGLAQEQLTAAKLRAIVKLALDAVSERSVDKRLGGTLARMHAQGTPAAFGFSVRQDSRNSLRYIVHITQGGLGLPEREYYLAKDERAAKQRAAYLLHVARMLELTGKSKADSAAGAERVVALETALAAASMPRVEARDPDKTYNLTTLAALVKSAPEFGWEDFFAGLSLVNPGDINIGQPEFVKALAALARETPRETWKTYFTWHALRALAPSMGGEFENEHFNFYGKVLTGVEAMESREQRVIAAIDSNLGDALGQLYVEKAFSPTAKARALSLVKNVTAALRDRIQELDWMGAATKREATTKLDSINVKIGYPDKWKDYSAVEIRRDDYLGNVMRATRAEFQRQLGRLGMPLDRSVWSMTAPRVNAYYSSGLNEIVFPAGILQAPFFDEKADDASNYGGIGMVIGHELTHGFDDRGRKFDAVGNRRDWWTAEDAARYTAKADAIAKQYDAYQPLPGMNINGRFTLGENIADFGGLRIAYLGLQKAQQAKSTSEREAKIDGFDANQRFFLSYAQAWRQNIREAELRRRLLTDSHSPARYRVLGPLGNLSEFQSAFGCQPGDAMLRAVTDQVTIW